MKAYANMPESQKETLIDLRDRLYEDHGCISHNSETTVLINLFYHLMYELSQAIDPSDNGWIDSEEFKQKHEQLIELLNYQRPNHPYSSEY